MRRRVFLVGYLGNWRPAAAVLFECQSLSGDITPGRGQRAKSTENVASGPGSYSRPADGRRIIGSTAVAPSMCAGPPFSRTGNSRVECEALVTQALTGRLGDGGPDDNKAQGGFYVPAFQFFGGNNSSGPIEVSPALNAHGSGSRRMDFESEAFIAYALRGEGFDASEDGTGRANLIPINLQVATRHKALGERTAFGIGLDGDPAYTLTKTHSHGVFIEETGVSPAKQPPRLAFAQNSRNELRVIGGEGEIAGCLSGQEGMKQRTYVASVAIRGRDGSATAELSGEVATALRASQGGGDKAHVLHNLSVRRLTPLECERLQGFPDHYTLIPWRGKSPELCPDGPRYKALGNSMAVPVMRWIGERIVWVESIMADLAA